MAESTNKKPGFFARVKGFFSRIVKYFRDTRSEMKKVVWPSKKQTLNNTVVVLVVMAVAAVVILLLDAVFGGVMGWLIGLAAA